MGLRDRPSRWRPAVVTCVGWTLCCVLGAALVAWPGRAEPSVARAQSPASRAAARSTNYRTRNVFVISIDGLRATEAFEADAAHRQLYIPNMNRLRQSGSLYRNVYNLGATWATPANYSIADGCLELAPPSEFYYRKFLPSYPTMFEYYRRAHPEVPLEKVWTVPGLRFTDLITCSSHALFGVQYAASGEALSPGDFDPWRPDGTTWNVLQSRMDQFHPSLVFANFGGLDLAADRYGEGAYRQAISRLDGIIGQLWDKIQRDQYYHDQTTLLVTASYGRRDDSVTSGDPVFTDITKGTGGISEGCKHVFVLALGPDIRAGAEFTETRQLTDICPTVGELLGFDTPLAQGRVLSEMIVGYQPRAARAQPSSGPALWQDETCITQSPGIVETPRVAMNGLGLHVVWVDSRSGQREICYKLRSPDGAWSADQELSASGSEARAPAIAVDGDMVHAVWQDYREGQWAIYHSQRSSDGRWSPPDPVAQSVLEQGSANPQMVWEPAVTACGGQISVAVPVSRYWLHVYHRTGSGPWLKDIIVDSTGRASPNQIALPQHARLASNGSYSYLLWQEVHNDTWKLKYARSTGCAGGWGASLGQPAYDVGGNDGSIAANGDNVYAAWITLRYLLWSEEPSDLRRNQSANEGQSWDPHHGNGIVVHSTACRNTDIAAAPDLTALVWEDYRVAGRLPVIYLSRSSDDGATWQEQPVSFGNDWSVEPSVATDGRTAYVVWRDRRDGTWQLYLARVSDVEPSPTATFSPTPTPTQTATPTATQTSTPTSTATNTPVELPTTTYAPSSTPSVTTTWTPTTTATPTRTSTPTQTATPTRTSYVVYLPTVNGFLSDASGSSPGILRPRTSAGPGARAATRRWLRTEPGE